jgi:hypothetical protein
VPQDGDGGALEAMPPAPGGLAGRVAGAPSVHDVEGLDPDVDGAARRTVHLTDDADPPWAASDEPPASASCTDFDGRSQLAVMRVLDPRLHDFGS